MSFAARRRVRRQSGHTLLETAISASIFVGMLVTGVTVFDSVAKAADASTARLETQAENQWALLDMVSDLQNSSTDARDVFGQPRIAIQAGVAPEPILDHRTGDMGGFVGQLGTADGDPNGNGNSDPNSNGNANAHSRRGAARAGDAHEQTSLGAAHFGGSQWGRLRSVSDAGADLIGTSALRPRSLAIATNSLLRIQRLQGFGIAAHGGAELTWGTPITYRVEDRRLVREQDGETRVVALGVVGFQCSVSDVGTVDVTVVSQKRTSAEGKVVYQANQISVSPRN